MQARWPVANGVSMMSSSNCSSACSASSRALTCSGVPEISEDSRRAMRVGRLPAWRAKRRPAPHCRRSPAGRSPARRPTPRPAAPARRRWPDRQRPPPDGDHRLTRAELAPAVEHGTAQRAVAMRWAAKTKFQSRRAASSALSAGAEEKPSARRGGSAWRVGSPRAQSATAGYPAAPADRQGPSPLDAGPAAGRGWRAAGRRRLADPEIDAARREGGQQVKFSATLGLWCWSDAAGPKTDPPGGPAAAITSSGEGSPADRCGVQRPRSGGSPRLRRVAPALMYAPAPARRFPGGKRTFIQNTDSIRHFAGSYESTCLHY